MKRLLLTLSALALVGSLATTAQAQGGLNFYWDGCPNTGVANKDFACDNEFDEFIAYGAFVAPSALADVSGQDIVIDILSESANSPAWWDFTEGGCRPTGTLSMGFARPAGCTPYKNHWSTGAGGIAVYRTSTTPGAPTPGPNRTRIIGAAGIADANVTPITDAQNVFSFSLTMTAEGTAACAGCATKMCLVLNQITLGTLTGAQIPVTDPAVSRTITFNGAGPDCSVAPVRNRTWGQVKALYR